MPALQGYLVYILVFFLSYFVSSFLPGSWSIGKSVIFQLALVLGVPLLASRLFHLPFRTVYRLNPLAWRDLVITLFLTLCLLVMLEEVNFVQSLFFPEFQIAYRQTEQLVRAASPWQFLWVLLSMAVIPAVCEESFFRGFLLERLSLVHPRWTAILLTSFLFGMFHQNSHSLLPAALAGVMLCFVLLRTQSIWSAIASHLFFNAVEIIMVNTSLRGLTPWLEGKSQVPAGFLILSLVGIWYGGSRLGRRSLPEGKINLDV